MIRKLGINQFEYDVEFKGDVRFPEITSTSTSLDTIVIDSTGKLFKSTGSEPDGIGFDGTGDLIIQQPTSDKDIIFIAPGTSDLGDTVTYITIDSSVARILFSQEARFTDNVNLKFGTGGDTMIYHDGSDSYIDHTGTGHLYIRQGNDDSDITFQSDNGSGGLATYYQIDGGSMKNNFFKSLLLTDNVKTLYGTGSDLQIYHDGSNSFISDTGTGDLYVEASSNFFLRDESNNQVWISAATTGVTLRYQDNVRLSTDSDGVDISGTLEITSSSATDFLKLTSTSGTANPIKLIFEKSSTEQGIIEYNRNGDLEIYNTDSDGGVMISGSASADPDFFISHAGASTFKSTLTVGEDTSGYDVTFFGSATGEKMIWDSSESQLKITHDTDDYGLGIFTVSSDQMTQPQIRVGRDEGQYWGVYTRDRDANVIHRQDETSGVMNTNFVQWDSNTSEATGTWNWQYGDGSGGSIATAMILTQAGQLNLPQNSATIGGTNLSNANLLIGSTSVGIGIDNNEIVSKGDHLYFGAGGSGKSIIFRSGGTSTALTLDSSQNATFGGDISLVDNKILQLGSGSADLQLLHDGSNSHVVNYTGDLKITNNANDKDVILNCDDGSGGNTAYITLDGSTTTTKFSKNTLYEDNVRVQFGTGTDANIRHDGTDTYIGNSTGHFYIQQAADDKDLVFQCDDGSGGLTTYMQIDGGFSSPQIIMPDNVQMNFGAGLDLRIIHDGFDSYISSNGTGHLYIRQLNDDKDIIFQCDDGSGGLQTYFFLDGSIKVSAFQNSDVVFYGASSYMQWDQSQDSLELLDNVKIKFGTGADLQIYHDGTTSKITNDVGDIHIQNNTDDGDIIFRSDDGSGGTTTYFKLSGANTNIELSKNLYAKDDVKIAAGDSLDLRMYHESSSNDSFIRNATGDLYIRNVADDKDIIFQSDDSSGNVETYFLLDGSANTAGNPVTLFPDNSLLGFGEGFGDLQLHHDGSNSYIKNRSTGDLYIRQDVDDKDIILEADDGSGGVTPYLTLDGSATNILASQTIKIIDDKAVLLGTDGDAFLKHTGSRLSLTNDTGDIVFTQRTDDGDIQFLCDDGSGGTTQYFRLDGGLSYTVAEKTIRFNDNQKAALGSGLDMQLYHNGSHSYIENNTGNIAITNNTDDGDIIFSSDDGSGGTTEYFRLDGSLAGSSVYTVWPDNSIAAFGSSADLRIEHTGSTASIFNTTGHLQIINYADDSDILLRSDDGSGNITTYLYLDGSNTITRAEKEIRFADSVKATFGNAADLDIYHDSTNSYVQNGTGDLYIENRADDKDIRFQCDDGSGGTQIYFMLDGSEARISTKVNNRFDDSVKLELGTSGDLDIYHDSNNSYIENATGDLYIQNKANDKDIIFQSDDGSGGFETYFFLDGSASSGNPITQFPDLSQLVFGDSQDLLLRHDGTDSLIQNNGGDFIISQHTNDKDLIFKCDDGSGSTTEYFRLDGDVGYMVASKAIRALDSVNLQLGASADFTMQHNGTNTILQNFTGDLEITQGADDSDIIFKSDNGSGGTTTYFKLQGGAEQTIFNKKVKLEDSVELRLGDGNDMRLHHNGSNNSIESYSGNLRLIQNTDDGDIQFFSDDGSGGTTEYFRVDGGTETNIFSKPIQVVGGDIDMDHGSITNSSNVLGFVAGSAKEAHISAARDVRIIIDNNNDDTDNRFEIHKHSVSSSNELLTLDQSGNLAVTGNLTVSTSATSSGIYAQFINLKGFCTLAANYKFAEDIEDTKSPYEMALDYGSATISSSTEVNQSNLFRSAGFHVPVACSVNAINMQVTCNNAGNVTVAVVEYRPSEAGTDQVDHPRTVYEEVVVASNDNNNKVKTVTVATADLDNTAIPAGSHIMIMAKGDSDSIGGSTFISAAIEIKW